MRFISAAIFSACCRTMLQVGADDPDRDRRQRAEAHDLGHDIARLEAEGRQSWPAARASASDSPPCSSRLASQGITRSGRTLRSRSRNSASLIPLSSRSATRNWPSSGPRMNSTMLSMPKFGGDLADEAHRDLDVLGLRLALDLLEALHRHLPRQLEVRARRRPEPQHELPRIDLREQLGADLQPQQPEDQRARRRDRPAPPASAAGRTSARPCRKPRASGRTAPRFSSPCSHVLEQGHAQDRHERAGEQVRRDHGEPDAPGSAA